MKTAEPHRSIFTPPSALEAERCVTCGEPVVTKYCPSCGEMRASDRKYSMLAFIREHVVEALVSLDGRVIKTAITLVRKPGELTAAFMRGSRIPYLPPLQCFLLFNLLFFVWSSYTKSQVLDTPLAVHLDGMPYRELARKLVAAKLETTHMSRAAFEAKFDAIGQAQARSLVLIMVPMFAFVAGWMTLGRRRPIVQHVVYALHTYSYFFLALPIVIYVIGIPLTLLLHALHVPPGEYEYDAQISTLLLLYLGSYIALSMRRAYGLGWWRSLAGALVCTFAVGEILQLYRRILFFITLRSM